MASPNDPVTSIIEATPAPRFRACTCCFTLDGLIEFRFGVSYSDKQATTTCVVLCSNCRQQLAVVLSKIGLDPEAPNANPGPCFGCAESVANHPNASGCQFWHDRILK